MSSPGHVRSFHLDGPAGQLEALLNVGAPNAEYAAVVTHPHPLYGGTMHNKVVFHAAKALNSFGFPVVRFNFRGVGTSAGEHDYGRGEIDDVRTALDYMRDQYDLPLIFCGFSFGSATGIRAACPYDAVEALISLGTPINAEGRLYTYALLAECTKPKLFLSGDHDEFAPKGVLAKLIETVAEPKRFVLIRDADHFFAGHLDEMRAEIELWLVQVLGVARP
jgi:uncharacterized protein